MHSGFGALRSQLPMNCTRQPRAPHWDDAVLRDVHRIEAIWRDLRGRFGGPQGLLCGDFGIVDAMFAPVCVRFRGYGMPVSEESRAYMSAIFALPAMREWQAAAEAEPARVEADEA
jgi:glutathione S-transferase